MIINLNAILSSYFTYLLKYLSLKALIKLLRNYCKKMIKALFLDMDKTLCDTEYSDRRSLVLWQKFLVKKFIKPSICKLICEEFVNGIYRKDPPVNTYKLPKENIKEEGVFRRKLLANIINYFYPKNNFSVMDIEGFIDEFNGLRMGYYNFFPAVKELLIELRKRFKLVVITNGPIYSQEPKLQATQMRDYVDFVLIGGEEREQKPQASIFQKALDLACVKKEEVLHIGDSLANDVVGAKSFGIKVVWVNPQKDNAEGIEVDFQVSSFLEVAHIIEKNF